MKKTINLLMILCGNIILAFNVAAFIEPTGIISGGTTGVGLFVQEYLGLPVSATYAVINIICFLLGLVSMGKSFAFTTLLSTVIFPFILRFFEGIPQISQLTGDLMLCGIFSGILSGIGVGLVIRFHASTGGLDIPPIVVNKYYGISVGTAMMIQNTIILLLQISFSSVEQILYGIIQTILISVVIDKVLTFGARQIKLLIISPHYAKIRQVLLDEGMGITLIPIETGYKGEHQKAILCATSPRCFPKVKNVIRTVDPTGFILLDNSTEIWGRGFTLPKYGD